MHSSAAPSTMAGKVNDDAYSDVIVGAPHYTNGEPYEGAAFVYHGSEGGLSEKESWTAEGSHDVFLVRRVQSRQPGT